MGRWPPESRQRLQAAALELFAAQGFEPTTVAEIAGRVGVTTRTFFRHFADKRDVLFAGSELLERQLADATVSAPADLGPLEAIASALAGLDWDQFAPRDAQRLRQEVIAASPELTERELIKLNGLTLALCEALRRRGSDPATAMLVAQTGIVVFRTVYGRWLDAASDLERAALVQAVLDELRAVVSPR